MKNRLFNLRNLLLILVPVLLILVVFRKFFFQGMVPIPGDILVGGYYPWLDSKWGYPVSVPVKNNLPSDVISIIFPWRMLGLQILRSGHFPLWDNTILLGVPLLANFQSALLNPVNILFFILPDIDAWSVQVILQLILMVLSMFLFLRSLKLSKHASVFGAMLYAFSGYSLVWLEYNSIVYTLAYFPLVLLFINKILGTPKIVWSFLLGVILALQVFSGYPLTVFYTLIFSSFYFFYRFVAEKQKSFSKKFLLFIFGITTGLALSAIQIIPGNELSSLSIRSFDKSALAGNIKYLPLSHLTSFFVPDFFGNPGTANYWAQGSYDNFAFFIPAVGIFFLLISIITSAAFKKKNLVFIFFIILGLLYATENWFTQSLLATEFLGLNSSVNTRVLFVVSFAASVLAAIGLDSFFKRRLKFWQKAVPVAVYCILIAGALGGYQFNKVFKNRLDAIDVWNPLFTEEARVEVVLLAQEFGRAMGDYKVAFRNTAIPSFVVLACFFLVHQRNKCFTFLALAALLILSTKTSFDKYLSFTRRDLVFPKIHALEELQYLLGNHRFEREKAEIFPANTWSVYGLRSASGQDSLGLLTTGRYLNLINTAALKDEVLTRYMHVENFKSPLFDTLDVEYFTALNRHEKESIPDPVGRPFPWIIPNKFKEIANIDTVRIYRNENNLGTAWFSKNIECLTDVQETADALIDENYNPSVMVFVDCQGEGLRDKIPGDAELITTEPNYLLFTVSTSEDNYLIISKARYPGWEAYIDGESVEIETANIALTGIYVPEGHHTLELFYRPQSFKIGAIISFATLSSWGLFFAGTIYRKKFL